MKIVNAKQSLNTIFFARLNYLIDFSASDYHNLNRKTLKYLFQYN